ncbi:hypothetical protein GW17_00047040 [Ensete ventricosum]|nr:hypothetical protein GW17_00047040 [Ensete ventricosum]
MCGYQACMPSNIIAEGFVLLLMGAPKQKWTAEEESALRAGVLKHGAGKWRTILKDPEFSSILCLRSNVDLKVKRNYRIAPTSAFSNGKTSKLLHHEGRQNEQYKIMRDDFRPVLRCQVDAELAQMRNMTSQEAASAAAQAVAEAEAAMAKAEEAAREAETAEADAEAAQAFAEAAMLTMKNRNNLMR